MTFDQWIGSIFNRPAPESAWDTDGDYWQGPAATIVAHLTRLFAEADTLLRSFSDAQAARGLAAVSDNTSAGYPFTLLDTSVPLRARLDCIDAMATLFAQYFAVRCTPHLSHWDRAETPAHVSPLNGVCYMWWDRLPLHGLAQIRPDHPDGSALDRAFFSVVRRCLDIPSVAVQESGLLGLFEWSHYVPETEAIAAEFAARPGLPPGLRAFALWVAS